MPTSDAVLAAIRKNAAALTSARAKLDRLENDRGELYLRAREAGLTYEQIANEVGLTAPAVVQKIRRTRGVA